jgi:hypothetical protein
MEPIMSKTTDADRELTNNELDAASGGALGFIEPRFPRDAGGGGGDAGPAINAWNTLLHQCGAAGLNGERA